MGLFMYFVVFATLSGLIVLAASIAIYVLILLMFGPLS